MLPAVLGLAAVQVNIIVNTQFAGLLGDGPVAQLSYAFRVFYLPVGLFSVALATVTAVRVAKDAARADLDALRASTGEGLAAVWMLMSGSAAGLCVLAVPIVQLLFERGAFGHADTLATAAVLQAYALGLLPYGLVKVLAPVFYGLDRPRMPLFASLTAVAVNLAFNAATYQALGAPGLALGTALGALANAVVLRLGVSRAVGPLGPGAAGRLVSLLLANLLLAGAVFGLWEGLSAHLPGRGATGQLALGAALLAVVSAGFGLYVLALRRLSYPGADLLARLPGQLYRRVRGRAG
jgi:putative peptidoglycan lipid II flippase